MTTTLSMLPSTYKEDSEIDITWSEVMATSEGGITGSKQQRLLPIRHFHLAYEDTQFEEVQKIYLANGGPHYPVAVRHLRDYALTDEVCTYASSGGTTTITIRKKFQPSTGSNIFYQRVLYIDQTNVALSVKVDGVTLAPANWTLIDFGKITTADANVPGGSVVTVSGELAYPVCFIDNSMTTKLRLIDYAQVQTIALRELLETELINRTA